MSETKGGGWPSCEHSQHYPWSWTPDVRDRMERVKARATEVFGNSVKIGVWLSGFNRDIGPGQICHAIKTEAGMLAALAELDRLAPITTPEPEPDWAALRRRRRRR